MYYKSQNIIYSKIYALEKWLIYKNDFSTKLSSNINKISIICNLKFFDCFERKIEKKDKEKYEVQKEHI